MRALLQRLGSAALFDKHLISAASARADLTADAAVGAGVGVGAVAGGAAKPPPGAGAGAGPGLQWNKETVVCVLVVVHLLALAYWGLVMYGAQRKAKVAKPREPPRRLKCVYEWAHLPVPRLSSLRLNLAKA